MIYDRQLARDLCDELEDEIDAEETDFKLDAVEMQLVVEVLRWKFEDERRRDAEFDARQDYGG